MYEDIKGIVYNLLNVMSCYLVFVCLDYVNSLKLMFVFLICLLEFLFSMNVYDEYR